MQNKACKTAPGCYPYELFPFCRPLQSGAAWIPQNMPRLSSPKPFCGTILGKKVRFNISVISLTVSVISYRFVLSSLLFSRYRILSLLTACSLSEEDCSTRVHLLPLSNRTEWNVSSLSPISQSGSIQTSKSFQIFQELKKRLKAYLMPFRRLSSTLFYCYYLVSFFIKWYFLFASYIILSACFNIPTTLFCSSLHRTPTERLPQSQMQPCISDHPLLCVHTHHSFFRPFRSI